VIPLTTGLDRLLADGARRLAGRPYALLAHGASVTAELMPAHLALARSAAGAPALLVAPEHGYYGVEQDMVPSESSADPWTGAPIASLYGDSAESLRPDPSLFDDVELLVVDLQDVGSRYYTYAATAIWAAEAALAAGREVWVLDRPNPLGGEAIEGGTVHPGFESFVGAFALPVRHGLTLGELVRLEARRRGFPEGLTVWRMSGWERGRLWEETGRPWIAPSPNMPTAATAALYPGGCLVEATTLSEGRGTTRPFHLVGAPGVDPVRVAGRLAERLARDAPGDPGVVALPTYFRPGFQKHAGSACGGLELARRALRVRRRPARDRPADRERSLPPGARERRRARGVDRGLALGRGGVPRGAPGAPAVPGARAGLRSRRDGGRVKRIHLLRYEGEPAALEALFAAVRAEGMRAGWLQADPERREEGPAGDAVEAGAFRAAAVAPGRVASVKRVAGPPVLRDLLREHFLGCTLVVVRPGGAGSALDAELSEAPILEPVGESLRVRPPGQAALDLAPEALAARLRRPRPWG
jgi:uncharacterized protein YbbC (DUF1343 family)